MAVKEYAVRDVVRLLKEAAAARSVVTYGELWRLFDRVDTEGDQWDTLEQAVKLVCDPREAIYGALMSSKKTGLPGLGFYRLYCDERSAEYRALVGDVELGDLTESEMSQITNAERQRVYEHAAAQ